MMSKRLKHPDLFFAVILVTGICVFRGLPLTGGYSLFFLIPLFMLIWHYAMPTLTGWVLIIVFMLVPYLFLLEKAWRQAGLSLEIESYGDAQIVMAIDIFLTVTWVIVTAYASRVTREDA
ncbi:hypothetical protein [Herbaspirillum sp. B65]|uniref:hypothetical protein n=1 Tax=Herbaspirillum sp. B65 TaxID=137708 RepID=UPI0005C983DD|nr:hypothetical protein [Herbaspirillum sp. B65]